MKKGFHIPRRSAVITPTGQSRSGRGGEAHLLCRGSHRIDVNHAVARARKEKIECVRRFLDGLNRKIEADRVKYDIVTAFGKLMELVGESCKRGVHPESLS